MSMKRRLRRQQQKEAFTKAQQGIINVMGQEMDLNAVPEVNAAFGRFRSAAEYQQHVSEILSHAVSTKEGMEEGEEHWDYFVSASKELEEYYMNVKRFVSERGMEFIAEADILGDNDALDVEIVPNLNVVELPTLD